MLCLLLLFQEARRLQYRVPSTPTATYSSLMKAMDTQQQPALTSLSSLSTSQQSKQSSGPYLPEWQRTYQMPQHDNLFAIDQTTFTAQEMAAFYQPPRPTYQEMHPPPRMRSVIRPVASPTVTQRDLLPVSTASETGRPTSCPALGESGETGQAGPTGDKQDSF